jgi:dienelactone hydrolase
VAIPVEKIQGPVLMISGKSDGLWPSAELTEFAMRRFASHGFPHRVEHLCYDGAGHNIAWPNVSTQSPKFKHQVSGEELTMGGSPAATAAASRDSWKQVLNFLQEAFA